jgi:hypothetical protein
MRAAKHFEIHEHKKPDGIPSGFFVSEHFQKLCDRKKVAAVFNRHAKYMQKERHGG